MLPRVGGLASRPLSSLRPRPTLPGRRNTSVEPPPGVSSISTCPPIASTRAWATKLPAASATYAPASTPPALSAIDNANVDAGQDCAGDDPHSLTDPGDASSASTSASTSARCSNEASARTSGRVGATSTSTRGDSTHVTPSAASSTSETETSSARIVSSPLSMRPTSTMSDPSNSSRSALRRTSAGPVGCRTVSATAPRIRVAVSWSSRPVDTRSSARASRAATSDSPSAPRLRALPPRSQPRSR